MDKDDLSPSEVEWIKDIVRDEEERKLNEETEKLKKLGLMEDRRIPQNRLEEILVEFYEALVKSHSPDRLSEFYTEQVAGYKDKTRLSRALEELGGLSKRKPKDEQEWSKHFNSFFSKWGEKCSEEAGGEEAVKTAINRKYPNLICDTPLYATEEIAELQQKNREMLEQQVAHIGEEIQNNREKYRELIDKVKNAQKTQIDGIALQLNKTIILGVDNWKMILYSILSTYCPKINITGLHFRNCIHISCCGDISTAKSTIADIILQIAPKAVCYDEFTKARFEGVYNQTTGEIEDGVIDEVSNSILLIKEYSPNLIPFERQFYDNTAITFGKGKDTKKVIPNTALFVCSNPKHDFFQQELLRGQIDFKEGILSRWDFLLPLIHTKEDNAKIIDNMDLFSENTTEHSFKEIANALLTITKGIKQYTGVSLNNDQKNKLKKTYYLHNINLKNRTLQVPRDMAILCRLVNVVVCSNFYNRKTKDNHLIAIDDDIDEAISLYEHIIHLRRVVYESSIRKVESIEDLIYQKIVLSGGGGISKIMLRSAICLVDNNGDYTKDIDGNILRGKCSVPTFYRKIKSLKLEDKVIEKCAGKDIKLYAVG